jgi:hypothetical protein
LSYEPLDFITILIPDFFGSYLNNTYWGTYGFWNRGLYIGILPLIFAFFSLFRLKNKHVLFFLMLALFSLLFALGKSGLLLYFFYHIPGFDLFRVPSRMLFFYNFAVIVLAGFGIDFLFSRDSKRMKKRLINKIPQVMLILSATILIFTLLLFIMKSQILGIGKFLLDNRFDPESLNLNSYNYYLDKINLAYGEILNGFALFALFLILSTFIIVYFYKSKLKNNLQYIKYAIILLIFLDLGLYSIKYIDTKDPKDVFLSNQIIDSIKNDLDNYRILDTTLLLVPQQTAIIHNIYKVNGFDPMVPVDYQKYVSLASGIELEPAALIQLKDIQIPLMYDMLNVKYIITDKLLENKQYKLLIDIKTFTYINNGINFIYDTRIDDEDFELISEQKAFLYENLNVFPRAYTVPNAVIVNNAEEALDILSSTNLNMKNFLILEKDPKKPLTNDGSFKEAEIKLYSPNEVIINVDVGNSNYLVLSDTFDKGWEAYDNGKKTEIYRANYILRSVYLEKGNHELIFRYEPEGYKIGKLISIITFVAVLLILAFNFLNKRKSS